MACVLFAQVWWGVLFLELMPSEGSGFQNNRRMDRNGIGSSKPLFKPELAKQEDNASQLEAALCHALRSPLKKFRSGRFAALAAWNADA